MAEERRRSQRVMLRVAVRLHMRVNERPVEIEAHTLVVNSHGAMLCVSQNLPTETQLEIERKQTHQRLHARVTRRAQSSPEGWLVPVEFEQASEEFWHVTFPPADWKPVD
jgi:hypothetical protein